MKISLGFVLIVTLAVAGIALGFTAEENVLIDEVRVHE